MLVRAYRLTDRFGIIILKGMVVLSDAIFSGLSRVRHAIARVLGVALGILIFVFGRFFVVTRRGSTTVARKAAQTAEQSMARRAARAEMEVGLAEDPLRIQNRVLSMLSLLLGIVVLAVILWATDPSRSQTTIVLPPPANNVSVASAPQSQNLNPIPPTAQQGQSVAAVTTSVPLLAPTQITIPTPVPTATPLPVILEVRGTLAYVAREKAQSDIWAIPVGSRSPLRITNSPADERDPAWSPDGKRLAYASRQDGNWEIYIYDVTTGNTSRLTYDLSFQGNPSWSPDGEWVAYESYQGSNLDIYVMRVDGQDLPLRLTDHPEPDFAPAWSPDGRSVAFISWRDGNQDIHLFSLDDPRDAAVINITNTLERHEDYPSWSPDGKLLAFSAIDAGQEKVFVTSITDLDAPAQVLQLGRTPSWSPDGVSLVFSVDSIDSTHLIAAPFNTGGISQEIIPVLRGASDPVWTSAPLPPSMINAGGLGQAVAQALFIEQESDPVKDPPYGLDIMNSVQAPNAVLSERVNDSFIALRERAYEESGWDFLGRLEDAFWPPNRLPQPGEERCNWLMTGRAFAFNRNHIVSFPAPVEVVREDLGVDIFWRVYIRVTDEAQSGQLGEPLRHMPWDFSSRTQGDVTAYDQGGRLRTSMPSGYYVDFTQLAEDFGWTRLAAGSDWRANINSANYWLFRKPDNLNWYNAMRELYTEAQLAGYVSCLPRSAAGSQPVATQQQVVQTAQPVIPTEAPAAGDGE